MLSVMIKNYIAGQPFMSQQIQQGYHHIGDTTHFLFDYQHYEAEEPSKVVLTGSFRGWSQDMDEAAWTLHRFSPTLWILSIYNPQYEVIPPRAEFKFRINEGEWIDPPATSPNKQGGNQVFLFDVTPPTLKAELTANKTIRTFIEGVNRPMQTEAFILTDAAGKQIPIAEILPNTANQSLLIPTQPIDIRKVYYLEIPEEKLKTVCSFDGWFRDLYSSKPLGAEIEGNTTSFRIFAPRATLVKLYLYEDPDTKRALSVIDMVQDKDGVWEYLHPENIKGLYYDFTVHGFDEPGNHFFESTPVHISDPYARVSMDSWGRARVWEKTTPASPLPNGIPAMEDVIAYEVHVQDFTDLLPVAEDKKGTISAMTVPGLTNSQGEPIGFDYLVKLGINVVHLMPVQEFLHYPDADWKAAFEDDPFMMKHGINQENYQWGYRTSHCFAIESRFRQRGTEPGAEREQFRDLVQAFHDKDIAVIIDIVPNHTAENMDGRENPYFFHFNVLDKQYYYRTKDLELIGEYGNEVKTENRPMVQRWLIDQCKHFIEEFGIDGFRIDLAGQIDQQTLIKLRNELGDDIIIYGEPWIGSYDPDFENNPDWDWYKIDSPITFFQDDARNALKGPTDTPKEKSKDRGFAGGNTDERENAMKALSSSFPEDKTPLSGINYLDIHDNWALADQFAVHDWDGRWGVDEWNYKIAAVMLYTSMGPIVTHGGSEIMRSKGLAELTETVKETASGTKVFLHGKRDTYNMRAANRFIWENVGKTRENDDTYCDYKSMYAFWQGLNKFRLSPYGKVFRTAEVVPADYYEWITPENRHMLGYLVDKKVMVLINTDPNEVTFQNVHFPDGQWKLIGNLFGISHEEGVPDHKQLEILQGNRNLDIHMGGTEFKIWVKS